MVELSARLVARTGESQTDLCLSRGPQTVADSSNGLDHVGVHAELLPEASNVMVQEIPIVVVLQVPYVRDQLRCRDHVIGAIHQARQKRVLASGQREVPAGERHTSLGSIHFEFAAARLDRQGGKHAARAQLALEHPSGSPSRFDGDLTQRTSAPKPICQVSQRTSGRCRTRTLRRSVQLVFPTCFHRTTPLRQHFMQYPSLYPRSSRSASNKKGSHRCSNQRRFPRCLTLSRARAGRERGARPIHRARHRPRAQRPNMSC